MRKVRVTDVVWRCMLGSLILVGCAKSITKTPQRSVPPAPAKFSLRDNVLDPPAVGMYHGAFPDIPGSDRDSVFNSIAAMERLADKNLAWVQFENDWAISTAFPWEAVQGIVAQNRVPYIRILPRSRSEQNLGADSVYTMENFLAGYFDDTLNTWAQMAKATNVHLVLEFCPEVNGNWYPWNGQWNGGAVTTGYGDPNLPDGPERFRDVYRRVIDIFRKAGNDKITWVFHVDSQPQPKEAWNAMANYYPGDDYIDWIGVSAFGAQQPSDFWDTFTDVLDGTYNELVAISPLKPVAVVEFGVIEKPDDPSAKAQWITDAFASLRNGWFPHVKAVSYWHERAVGVSPARSLRIDSSAAALAAYKAGVAGEFFATEAKFTPITVAMPQLSP